MLATIHLFTVRVPSTSILIGSWWFLKLSQSDTRWW